MFKAQKMVPLEVINRPEKYTSSRSSWSKDFRDQMTKPSLESLPTCLSLKTGRRKQRRVCSTFLKLYMHGKARPAPAAFTSTDGEGEREREILISWDFGPLSGQSYTCQPLTVPCRNQTRPYILFSEHFLCIISFFLSSLSPRNFDHTRSFNLSFLVVRPFLGVLLSCPRLLVQPTWFSREVFVCYQHWAKEISLWRGE